MSGGYKLKITNNVLRRSINTKHFVTGIYLGKWEETPYMVIKDGDRYRFLDLLSGIAQSPSWATLEDLDLASNNKDDYELTAELILE